MNPLRPVQRGGPSPAAKPTSHGDIISYSCSRWGILRNPDLRLHGANFGNFNQRRLPPSPPPNPAPGSLPENPALATAFNSYLPHRQPKHLLIRRPRSSTGAPAPCANCSRLGGFSLCTSRETGCPRRVRDDALILAAPFERGPMASKSIIMNNVVSRRRRLPSWIQPQRWLSARELAFTANKSCQVIFRIPLNTNSARGPPSPAPSKASPPASVIQQFQDIHTVYGQTDLIRIQHT